MSKSKVMKDQFIAIRLSSTEKRLLEKGARKAGCNVSDYIRTVLRCVSMGLVKTPKLELTGRQYNRVKDKVHEE